MSVVCDRKGGNALSFPSAFHPHLHLTPQSERTYPKTGAFVQNVSDKHMTDVPGRKRTRKVPRRIMLLSRIWDTAWGQRVGVWDRSCGAFSAAPAAPLCAPQTDQQPAATFTARIAVRPPVEGKVPQVSKSPAEHTAEPLENVSEQSARRRGCVRVRGRVSVTSAKAPASQRAARTNQRASPGCSCARRTVITTRLR